MTQPKNIMVDLETLGTVPGSKIISIGAAVFSKEGVTDTFYVNIKLQEQGVLTEDPATIAWWAEQTEAVREEAFGDCPERVGLAEALLKFSRWLNDVADGDPVMWGNGSDFDQPILAAAYREVGIPVPWKFWNSRCYRTLRAIAPQIPFRRVGAHHNALYDAISQAQHAAGILMYLSAVTTGEDPLIFNW